MTAMDKRLWSILDQYVPQFAVENQFVLPKLKPVVSNNATETKLSLPKLKIS
jgi:hypothetical protein